MAELHQICVHVPAAVDRSSSDVVAICYALPVLRMTSCFHTIGPYDVMFGRIRQVAVPVGRHYSVWLSSSEYIPHRGSSLLSLIGLLLSASFRAVDYTGDRLFFGL